MTTVEVYPQRDFHSVQHRKQEMSLATYLDLISAPSDAGAERYYLAERSLKKDLPELVGDIEVPPFVDRTEIMTAVIFLGRDTASGIHYHRSSEALLCQVVGKKRVALFAPDQADHLYATTSNHAGLRNSFDVDTRRFPKAAMAQPMECVLEPGDALFIPIHWWHGVEGAGFNTSVTFFWRTRVRKIFSPPQGLAGFLPLLRRPHGLLVALGLAKPGEQW
jgi:jumonji domain-containing protein 7